MIDPELTLEQQALVDLRYLQALHAARLREVPTTDEPFDPTTILSRPYRRQTEEEAEAEAREVAGKFARILRRRNAGGDAQYRLGTDLIAAAAGWDRRPE